MIRTAVSASLLNEKKIEQLMNDVAYHQDETVRLKAIIQAQGRGSKKKRVSRSNSIQSNVVDLSVNRATSSHFTLHETLEEFVTLTDAPGPDRVLRRAGSGGIEALQAAVGSDPSNKKAAAALRKEVDVFAAAMEDEIAQRLSSAQTTTKTVGQALVVVRDGNSSFKQVYTAVVDHIKSTEARGMASYSEAAIALAAEIPGGGAGQKPSKPTQRKAAANDAVQLLSDAVVTKDTFDTVVHDLVAKAKAAGLRVTVELADVKNVDRVVQKGW